MSTIAKFQCTSVTKTKHWDGTGRFLYTASLNPVMTGSDENKSFFAATPTGKIELGQFSSEQFEAGKEYYVEFKEA